MVAEVYALQGNVTMSLYQVKTKDENIYNTPEPKYFAIHFQKNPDFPIKFNLLLIENFEEPHILHKYTQVARQCF